MNPQFNSEITDLPAPATIPSRAGAVPQSERIESIDALRGFALLGILAMNIQAFAMIGLAYVNPFVFGDMTGANYWVWYLSHIFADQKFMTIFSMLFGAGIILMTGRQEANAGRPAKTHYRRMAVLLLFGLLHAYFIWYGDILVAYALCGMIVYPFRRFRPRTLIIIGLIAIAVHSAINQAVSMSLPHWPAEARAEFVRGMSAPADEVQKELAAYRGGWLQQLPERAKASLMFQTLMFGTWTLWRAGGLMLIGMALFKLNVFSAKRSAAFYSTMLVVGLAIGIPLIMYGKVQNDLHHWEPTYLMFTGTEFNYWGSLFVSFAYVGAMMLACQATAGQWLTRRLAAVGQMAFTNYLMQSIICTTIFYGHGFGLYGFVERVGQFGIVLAIWAFQLIVSPIWLTYFRFGPAEWLWRAMTYGTWPAMLRRPMPTSEVVVP